MKIPTMTILVLIRSINGGDVVPYLVSSNFEYKMMQQYASVKFPEGCVSKCKVCRNVEEALALYTKVQDVKVH